MVATHGRLWDILEDVSLEILDDYFFTDCLLEYSTRPRDSESPIVGSR